MKFSYLWFAGILGSQATAQSKSSKASTLTPTATPAPSKYEVWASDQSNSVPGESSAGTKGSFIWIWESDAIAKQVAGGPDATPLPCTPTKDVGPCNTLDVFPLSLVGVDADGVEKGQLGTMPAPGRLHGMLKDPSNRYVTASFFNPSAGYVGVIDTHTKEAIALFRVTKTSNGAGQRSVHMSFWSHDGNAIIVGNLDGKMIERIDVIRDATGKITNLKFNVSAGVYLGKGFALVEEAIAFTGGNAFGRDLVGEVVGSYSESDIGDLTPAGVCKESGCGGRDNEGGLRTNNVPICPITSTQNNVYVTLGSGGLFVLKHDTTPMKMVGEYGNSVINGAGCGGGEANRQVFVNAGVSASAAGATQSTFGLYAFDDYTYNINATPVQNSPYPIQVFKDKTNTNTLGNIDGSNSSNDSGQLPTSTTRRDSHGSIVTVDGRYIHVADRVQNLMEVFDTTTYQRVNTYDVMSIDGKTGRQGPAAACLAKSILDDALLPRNDPAMDLIDVTPDGKYFMVALRGPNPVSVPHATQGSCPGVGVVKISEDGKAGMLLAVLRSTNTVDTVPVGTVPGGYNYRGLERSDVHHATVIRKD